MSILAKRICIMYAAMYRGAVGAKELVGGGMQQGLRESVMAVSGLWRRISSCPVHHREVWRQSSWWWWRHVDGVWNGSGQWVIGACWQTAARQLVSVPSVCWESRWYWTIHRATTTRRHSATLRYACTHAHCLLITQSQNSEVSNLVIGDEEAA